MMLASGGELNGKRLLSRKAVEMMTAAHVPDTLPGPPAGEGYGLSVRVVTNHAVRGTMLSDGTYGWSGAQGTHFFVDPKEQLVGVMMVQTSNPGASGEFEDLGGPIDHRLGPELACGGLPGFIRWTKTTPSRWRPPRFVSASASRARSGWTSPHSVSGTPSC